MSDRKYYVTCLYPTATVTKGNDYIIEEDSGNRVSIYNDHGNKVSLMKYRFGDIKIGKEESTKSLETITCINDSKFKSITQGNVYEVTKESRDFYYIKNNLGANQRYGKIYFQRNESKEVKTSAKKEMAVCVYPVLNELSFKEAYSFTSTLNNNIIVKNDRGAKRSYIKKRFLIEMR